MTGKDSSVINVYEGGRLTGWSGGACELYDLSRLNVYGGDVSLFFTAHDYTVVNIHDGLLLGIISLVDHSTLNVYGGHISSGCGFGVDPSGTVNIYGYDFQYDPRWYWSDDLISGPCWVSKLTGRGFEDITIEITGIADPSEYPNIHLIPEPTTLLLLRLGGPGLLWKIPLRDSAA